jgi:hypothetical protein
MPVWGVVISTQQVSDLISYLRAGLPAVQTAEAPAIPQGQGLAVEGATLLPSLSGVDFRKEFNTDAKIIGFIRSGSVIGRAPIVSMPHWGGIIPEQQLRAFVAYLKTLK